MSLLMDLLMQMWVPLRDADISLGILNEVKDTEKKVKQKEMCLLLR